MKNVLLAGYRREVIKVIYDVNGLCLFARCYTRRDILL